jgi:hypothetical protein
VQMQHGGLTWLGSPSRARLLALLAAAGLRPMAADPSYERARVDTGARSDERSYEGVASSSSLEGRSRGLEDRTGGDRWTRAELKERWKKGPPYTFPPPDPREVTALGESYEQLTGRRYKDTQNKLLTAVMRVHGPNSRRVLHEEHLAGGPENLLGRARCRWPEQTPPEPQPRRIDGPVEPVHISELMETRPPREEPRPPSHSQPLPQGPTSPTCRACGGPTDPVPGGQVCRQSCFLDKVNEPLERGVGRR